VDYFKRVISLKSSRTSDDVPADNEQQLLGVLAEMGRVTTGSRSVGEVYDQLAELTSRLIEFDRMVVSLIDGDEAFDAFIAGSELDGYPRGTRYPLSESGMALLGGSGAPIQLDLTSDEVGASAATSAARKSGLTSMIIAPLIWNEVAIGTLQFRSATTISLDETLSHRVSRVADQLSGAIAQSQARAALDSRVKSLECLYGVVDLLRTDALLPEIAWQVANLIPPAMRFPEVAVSRITLDGLQFQTSGFMASPWMISSDITLNSITRGAIEVGYTEPVDLIGNQGFIPSEYNLVGRISELLGSAVEGRAREDDLLIQKSAMRASVDAIITANRSGEILTANSAVARMFGANSAEELIGRSVADLVPNRYREAHQEGIKRANRDEEPRIIGKTVEIEALSLDGTEFPIEISLSRIEDHARARYVAVLRDITTRKSEQKDLLITSSALHAADDSIVVTDPKGDIQFVNQAFTRHTGYTPMEAIGRNTRMLKSDAQDAAWYKDLWDTISGGHTWHGELINRRKNGTLITEEMSITPLRVDGNEITHYITINRDITDRKRAEAEFARLSTTDTLTGLLNRNQFEVLLTQASRLLKEQGASGALILLDLDGFKLINETYGVSVGDELLVKISSLIKESLRESDPLARVGGDEFGVIIHDFTQEEALALSNELIRRISTLSHQTNGNPVAVGCSAGLTKIPLDGDKAKDAFTRAATALYHSKRSGKSRSTLYDDVPNLHQLRTSLQHTRERIAGAMSEDRIEIFWQPIVGTRTRQPLMHEVLARIRNADGQLTPPDQFIVEAEQLDLIQSLDWHIVNIALQRGAEMASPEKEVRLAINISPRTIESDFANNMLEILDRTGYPATSLTLEITETAMLSVNEQSQRELGTLKRHGISLSMDDFGSGAASLRNLRAVPFDYMKMDGEYVTNLAANDADQRFVSGLSQLAGTLGLEVVAEHVQDDWTMSFLADAGVGFAQGYHVGMPEPMPGG